MCEEKECNGNELLTINQNFEEGHRPIEHSCKKEKEKLKCRTLIYRGSPNTEMKRLTNT